jgi:ADP-ribose pyrophosphatase YjhB (NUDIX family)
MYIKIYFEDKPLFLCDAIDDTIQPFVHHDDAIFIDELNAHTVRTMIHEMEVADIHAGVFYHPDLQQLLKSFFKRFTLIKAAGGIVLNEKKEVLMIFRKGSWDLPKGKLDGNEKLEDCALREVKEETGLKELSLTATSAVTYHTYHEGSRHILKESHWFRMKAPGEQSLKAQEEEQITDIRWVKKTELAGYFPRTYPLIADLLANELPSI